MALKLILDFKSHFPELCVQIYHKCKLANVVSGNIRVKNVQYLTH